MLRLNSTERTNGKVSLTVWQESGHLSIFATAFLIDHKDEPLNTLRADFDAINRLHIIAALFEIADLEFRVSYDGGLSREELKSIDVAFKYKTRDLSELLSQKRQGAVALDTFRQLNQLLRTSPATELVRKSSLLKYLKYLKWLSNKGDAALSRYVVSSDDLLAMQGQRCLMTEEIRPLKQAARSRRSKFNPVDLSRLEEFLESYERRLARLSRRPEDVCHQCKKAKQFKISAGI